MAQQERLRDPYPFTWEIPALIVTAALLTLACGVHAGRGLATLISGKGWTWPPTPQLIVSVPAILAGNAAAGLSTAVRVPSVLLWTCIGTVEAALLVGLVAGVRATITRWGPTRVRGLATHEQAQRVLGPVRLRRAAAVIRPDLHPHQGTARLRFDPTQIGWRIGTSLNPAGGQLWCPWDRTAGVIGPQGSGKTLDVLIPALLAAPGAALVTLTKPDDLLLTLTPRSQHGRPCLVLDPFQLVHGLDQLVWNPIEGCTDPMTAERRAKAFVKGALTGTGNDSAARFYAGESAKVLQAFLHAAALADRTIDDLLSWIAHPLASIEPVEILREHPSAAPLWDGLLHGALHGDERTVGNTITTVQQCLGLFFQADIRRRCTPSAGQPATDIADIIRRGGTIYLLGREDPYASACALMTAVAEHVLDTALHLAHTSPHGRLCPPLLACLDELPSTAPLPTLRTRMANERALGISFIYAAQTMRQLHATLGEDEARALFGLTNTLIVFGGSKDVRFNQEISDLLGTVRVSRSTWQTGPHPTRSNSGEDVAVFQAAEIRQLPERQALVIAENAKPLIARLHRAIDGKPGRGLLAQQQAARRAAADAPIAKLSRAAQALAAGHGHPHATPSATAGDLAADRDHTDLVR